MEIELGYGRAMKTLDIADDNVAAVVYPQDQPGVDDPVAAVARSLDTPIDSASLGEIIAEYRVPRVAIIVNDITRPVPYRYILPPLMKQLETVPPDKIDFIVATGIHRGQTDREHRELYSDEIVDTYRVTNHDCDRGLVDFGTLGDGTPLSINERVAAADVVVGTGMISLHYFAGYSGGRKAIVPGVSGRDIITRSHSMMVDPRAQCGCIADNPVSDMMLEGARRIPRLFIVNVVTNSKKEIVRVVSGHMEKAWKEGVEVCRDMFCYPMDRKYPVVIASAGGYPKDINVYQAQKALEYASYATEEGGTIVLVAECGEGYGEATFERWMKEASNPEEVLDRMNGGFELGGHKAFAIARTVCEKDVVLVSGLTVERVENLFCHWAGTLSEALSWIKKKHGSSFRALIMPEAGSTFPVVS